MKKLLVGALVLALMLSIAIATSAKSVVIAGQEIQEQKEFYNEVPEIQVCVSENEISAFASVRGYLYLVLEYPDGKEVFILPNGKNFNNVLKPYEWRKVASLPKDLSLGNTYELKAVFSRKEIFGFYFRLNKLYLSTKEVEYLGPGGAYNSIAYDQIYLALMPAANLPICPYPSEGERLWHAYFPDGTEGVVTQSEMVWLIIHGY